MKSRPVAITNLAFLLWLAGAVNVIGALQKFGRLPMFGSGGVTLAGNLIDGWLLAAMAIVSLFLAGGLWAEHSWAKRAVLVVAALNILVTFFAQFGGGQSWVGAVPGIVLNAAILIYARTPGARSALDG